MSISFEAPATTDPADFCPHAMECLSWLRRTTAPDTKLPGTLPTYKDVQGYLAMGRNVQARIQTLGEQHGDWNLTGHHPSTDPQLTYEEYRSDFIELSAVPNVIGSARMGMLFAKLVQRVDHTRNEEGHTTAFEPMEFGIEYYQIDNEKTPIAYVGLPPYSRWSHTVEAHETALAEGEFPHIEMESLGTMVDLLEAVTFIEEQVGVVPVSPAAGDGPL